MLNCSLRRKRTAREKNKHDKAKTAESRPSYRSGSRRSFLVYIAAILCHEPILAQPLGFVHGFASAVEQSAVQRAVGVVYLGDTVGISEINTSFFAGKQVDRIHVQRSFNFHLCAGNTTSVIVSCPTSKGHRCFDQRFLQIFSLLPDSQKLTAAVRFGWLFRS